MSSIKQRNKIKKRYKVFSASFVFLFVTLSFVPKTIFAQYGTGTYGLCYYANNNCTKYNGGGGSTSGGSTSGGSNLANNATSANTTVTNKNLNTNTSSSSNANIIKNNQLPAIVYSTQSSTQSIDLKSKILLSLSSASLITGVAWLIYLAYHHSQSKNHHITIKHA